MSLETTEDALLGGRVIFHQPAAGYRAAIDPILLAAAVPARPGQTVMDLGAGAGAATLCLAARVDHISVIGVERNPDLAGILARNAEANGMADRVSVQCADIGDLRPPAGGADHVMANPPYRLAGSGTRHAAAWQNDATIEGASDLGAWVRAAAGCVRHKGGIVFIHQADRVAALVAALAPLAGEIALMPLSPRAGAPARRVVVRARKGVRGGSAILPGLVLHEDDGRFTPAAEAILRAGAPFA